MWTMNATSSGSSETTSSPTAWRETSSSSFASSTERVIFGSYSDERSNPSASRRPLAGQVNGKKDNQTSDSGEVQVFELTTDNSEDQDELNRRLRKPGEPDRCPTAQ